jgi:hypothetical protein
VLRPGAVFRAAPEGTPGDAASNFNDRPFSIRVTAPPRSAVAYVQKQ